VKDIRFRHGAYTLAVKARILLLLTSLFVAPMLRAQQTVDELRDLARNPVSDAIKVPFVESINFNAGPYDRTSNSLQLQPVIPLQISENWLFVPRIEAAALVYGPDVARTKGGTTGLGDTVATFFFTPFHARQLIWAVGPALLIPTATDSRLGTGKWDLGPSVALLVQPDWGFVGLVVQNIWSLPGHDSRASGNQLQIETQFSYNLPHGWYLGTAPTINADWTQVAGDRWLLPFGGGAGKTFNIGNQAMDSNVALYYNAVRPASQLYPRWQLSFQLTLLYPKEHKPNSKDRQSSLPVDRRAEAN
jgi:hypothetical protein